MAKTQVLKKTLVLLQYPVQGARISEYKMSDGSHPTVHADNAEKYVALDSASGGYPYGTSIQNAHDFGTVEKAVAYAGKITYFKVRIAEVTYEVYV